MKVRGIAATVQGQRQIQRPHSATLTQIAFSAFPDADYIIVGHGHALPRLSGRACDRLGVLWPQTHLRSHLHLGQVREKVLRVLVNQGTAKAMGMLTDLLLEICEGSSKAAGVAAMMRAHFDDSSDEKRARYTVCGGPFGTAGSWDKAEMAWSTRTNRLAGPFS